MCFFEFVHINACCSKLVCNLCYNFKIKYFIRFVFVCAVAVNFWSEIQINRIFDILM